jgi:hypothetical protein
MPTVGTLAVSVVSRSASTRAARASFADTNRAHFLAQSRPHTL